MDMSLSELRELVMDREALHAVIHGVAKSQTRLSDWSHLIWSDGVSTLSFLGNLHTISIVFVPIYIPSNIVGEFPFLQTLSSIHYFWTL